MTSLFATKVVTMLGTQSLLEIRKIVLHLIPSGILHDHCVSVVGHGVVFDPRAFKEELEHVRKAGVDVTPDRLKISENCSVITYYNKLLDGQRGKVPQNRTTGKESVLLTKTRLLVKDLS